MLQRQLTRDGSKVRISKASFNGGEKGPNVELH